MRGSGAGSDDAEARIRAAWERRAFDRALTDALTAYGPEILGLLVAMHRDHDEASEAFSIFAERLWKAMDRFEFKCSMRTWAYMVARRVSLDMMRSAKARRRRQRPLSDVPEITALVAQVRTRTLSLYREENLSAFVELRRQLPEADQLLLVLRVDREMAWDDLARVFLERDEPSADDVKRESARLRKRFQLVKERLRALGEERGLLPRRE